MDDRQHAHPALPHLVDDAEELKLMADVQVRRRLVEQQDLGLLGESPRQQNELALARREGADATPGQMAGASLAQGAASPPPRRRRVNGRNGPRCG